MPCEELRMKHKAAKIEFHSTALEIKSNGIKIAPTFFNDFAVVFLVN